MKYVDLRCVRCDCDFEGESEWSDGCPPTGGVIFTSHGNYGSKLYDEPTYSPNYIAVIVCDSCLRELAADSNVMYVRPIRTVVNDERVEWSPETHDPYYVVEADG